jgi:hypothetical protein
MSTNRRRFLEVMVPAGIALMVHPAAATAAQQRPMQQPPPSSGSPRPGDVDPNLPPLDTKKILKANQQKIEDDVQKLFALATELRDQVKNTDSSSFLSVGLVQKAEEVEKLAHQIRSLAKG